MEFAGETDIVLCAVRQCLPILFAHGTLNKILIRETKDHNKVGIIGNKF